MLAQAIPWQKLEQQFALLYFHTGLPSYPLRKMAGLWRLKHVYHLSDERLVALWQENPYCWYFCGEATFQWTQRCAASDLVHFRKRWTRRGFDIVLADLELEVCLTR